MNLQNLLENAHLDALGLLDERELAEFNAAFAAAPPGVRAQVREEQARWANLDFLLPMVEPPSDLKARVIGAVRQAREAEVDAQIRASALALAAPDAQENAAANPYHLQRSTRVSSMWRGAAIGLLGVAAVLSVAFMNVMAINSQIKRELSTAELPRDLLRKVDGDGRINETLFSQSTKRYHFAVVSSQVAGAVASLNTNPAWDSATLNVRDLPARSDSSVYHLVRISDDGIVLDDLRSLGSGGGKDIFTADINSATLRTVGTRLAIVLVSPSLPLAQGRALSADSLMLTVTLG